MMAPLSGPPERGEPSLSGEGVATAGGRGGAEAPRGRARTFLRRAAYVLVGLPALWQIALLVRICASRLCYPMDIEWNESGFLYQAYRVINGLPIYGPPSQGFLPYPYPPGYTLILALAGRLFGLDYSTGRAVSLLFFVVGSAVLAREVWVHHSARRGAPLWALLSLGTIAASFPVTGGWYDLVRNDTMTMALVVIAAALVGAERPTRVRTGLAAAALVAAVFTRQPAAFFAVWICAFALWRSRRLGLMLTLCTGAGCVALLAALILTTHGWAWTYILGIYARHTLRLGYLWMGVGIAARFAPFVLLIPLLVRVLALGRQLSPRAVLWSGMIACALPASLLPFAKIHGWRNDLLPVVFLLGPVSIILLSDLLASLEARGRSSPAFRWLLLIGLSLFLVKRNYVPSEYIVTPQRREQAEVANRFIAKLQGGVLVPNQPFLAVRNGQTTPQIHTQAYADAFLSFVPGLDFFGYVRRANARWAVLSNKQLPPVREWILEDYEVVGRLPVQVTTMTGFPCGPLVLARRRTGPMKSARTVPE